MISDRTKGYALAALAAAAYGLNPLFALPLYAAGMTADSVLMFRYLIAIPIVAVMIVLRGRSFKVSRHDMLLLVVMGLLMAVSSLTLFLGYNYMDAGIASTILFVYPVMVACIMAGVYREKVSLLTAGCIALAFGGIALLFNNGSGDGGALSVTGTVLVLISALSYAIYIVGLNKSSLDKVATLTVTFYSLLFGVFLFIGRLWFDGDVELPSGDRWYLWFNLVALAVFPTVVSLVCMTSAIHYIGSTPTAIMGALEPVTAVVIGVAVFGETLTFINVVGLSLVIVAVTGVVAGDGVHPLLMRMRRMFPRLRRPGK